jgi:hypothetical protein
MDADGQHRGDLIKNFIAALRDGADVAIGVRDYKQRFAEHIFALLTRILWNVHDPLCGMKGYRMDIYRELGHFDSYRSIGTELALFAARRGRRVIQTPVPVRPRRGAPRFGSAAIANYRIVRSMLLALRQQITTRR